MKVSNDKHLGDMHLVADIRKRNEQLEELLMYVYIMHQIEYGQTSQDQKYERPEDEAVFNVVSNLGFIPMSSSKNRQALPIKTNEEMAMLCSIEFETVAGLKRNCKVYASNIFSQTRGRKSMIISDMTTSEQDVYTLVTIGSEKSMKTVIRPFRNKKEDNLLKILVAK